MSELAWRFFFWITPRWLSKKFQMYMLRCYVERYPSEVERSMRESARATKKQHFPETGWSEEELVALYKQSLDLILQPEVFLDLASVFGIPGMASKSARTPDGR